MRALASTAASFVVGSAILMGATACADLPPPEWAHGGAPLSFSRAWWRNGEGADIELRPDGTVLADGSVTFILDRAGRIYDPQKEPVAILLPDGHIGGVNHHDLGRIGITNASPPGGDLAWLSVLPDGHVIHFEPDGERASDGVWRGCDGPQFRTCTLITQLVTLERVVAARRGSVVVGVGIGVGFWP